MKGMIRKCTSCGEYTLHEERCPHCGGAIRNPHPAKFSPDDRYSRFRLRLKLEEKGREKEGEEE